MDDLKRVAQQFAQAANVAGPASSIPEMTNFFRSAFMEPMVKQGLAGGGALAGQKAQEADAADEAARKAAIANAQRKLDPSNYRMERKADGGFDFYDPDNKLIDINTFSQRTGKNRVDILSDSENPVDLAYVDDFKRMRQGMQAMYSGDPNEKEAFLQSNPELRQRTVQDYASELIKKYPHIYGRGTYQDTLGRSGQDIFRASGIGGGGGNSGGASGGWSAT